MPELLKDRYSIEFIASIANNCKKHYAPFKKAAFKKSVLSNDWQQLELKERMRRISSILGDFLPEDYSESVAIILRVAENYSDLEHMCFPDYIEQFGLDHFNISMKALEQLTEGFSSEFAIRPFIIRYPDKTMAKMKRWSQSHNEHVRRLASEGCRPRLPWAMALPVFKKDPGKVLEVILDLIDDESLYVRRSVANNLNDISKDNPDLIVKIAEKYLGQSKDVDWVIKHACRGLLKQGHKKVLSLFGYTNARHVSVVNLKIDKKVAVGEKLDFEFVLSSKVKKLGQLRVEFIIDFMKSNGKTSGKIFKISEGDYLGASRSISKCFSFKPISTRKYYLGDHQITIVVNGVKKESEFFELVAS